MEQAWCRYPATVRPEACGTSDQSPRAIGTAVGIARLLQDQAPRGRLPVVYQVEDDQLIVLVIAVGRRDRKRVYKIAAGRLD